MTDHYVTPAEAEDKLCPLFPNDTCYGPRCMAWRWVNLIKEVKDIDDCVIREGLFSTTHGYCGMAKP